MTEWDGRTERRANAGDHDKLTRLLEAVENHVRNFDKHVKDDEIAFKDIGNKLWNHARFIYIGIGIIAVLQLIVKGH